MDVNGTKFHLLLGRADWEKCTLADGTALGEIWKKESEGENEGEPQFAWNEKLKAITLQPQIFRFKTSLKNKKPDLKMRRGAARDRYGNWFWIDETGTKIKVLSVGSKTVSTFYPNAESVCAESNGKDFHPVETKTQTAIETFRGIAVTIDHYLVVGTVEPAGLLIFDLFSTGEPRRILWREDIKFAPFDIAARFCGGVFVLDRENKRYWTLDRSFGVVGESPFENPAEFQSFEKKDAFQPADETENARKHYQKIPAEKFYFELSQGKDPISIEALPDDTVLILNLAEEDEDFSIIERYYRADKLDDLSTDSLKDFIYEDETVITSPAKKFRLRGYDIAFVKGSDEEETDDRLFIVPEEGDQAFVFDLICKNDLQISPAPELPAGVVKKNFELRPVAEYFPMRLYGGKGFAAADGDVFFDFGERFLPLVKQNRPRYNTDAVLDSPVFDGKEPNCVWHRLLLDGCLPPETFVEIYSRTADDKKEIDKANWSKEPNLYLRGNGSEIPFVNNPVSKEKGAGTWELLLQNAKSRFLQLRLVFSGNGQKTPRVSAIRVYYPRFSYLENYLPSIYREDEPSAFFLDRFLANFEGIYTSIEDRIAAVQMLFDIRSAPSETLEWLAGWFGIVLDPNWQDDKRRLFIKRAIDFYQFRGTMRGLRAALRLALYPCADESIFDAQTAKEKRLDPIRIVERFQTRRTPKIIPSDFVTEENRPRVVEQTEKWKPNQGADVLHQRYDGKFENKANRKFSLSKPEETEEAAIWESFALSVLGFVPSGAAASERKQWQSFLSAEHAGVIAGVNQAHGKNYSDFDEIFLPIGTETNANLKTDWKNFVAETSASSRYRRLWQDFLARRYRRIGQLNQVYGTNWDSFEFVSLFDRLPASNQPLADWFLFESVVLAMRQTAHRFTVLIPANIGGQKPDTAEQQKTKLEIVRRVIEIEKPAHTVFDFRYYWNLFRLEEVRLGFDTLLGLGSRDPLLSPELVIGENFVGESRIGTAQPEKYPIRYVLGSENLTKKQKEEEKK